MRSISRSLFCFAVAEGDALYGAGAVFVCKPMTKN